MKNDSIIVQSADPADPEDGNVTADGLERGLLGRALRQLRSQLNLSTADFAARYGIPESEYVGYESVRVAPPAAVMAYLRVIIAEPDAAASAVQRAA